VVGDGENQREPDLEKIRVGGKEKGKVGHGTWYLKALALQSEGSCKGEKSMESEGKTSRNQGLP